MISKAMRFLAAALALFLLAGEVQATPFYYNVDNQTLPGGPIQLQAGSIAATGGGWLVSGNAVNLTSSTYNNVLLLNQFIYQTSPPGAYAFTSGPETWTGDGNTLQLMAPSGSLSMTDTSAPLNWTYGGNTATLNASDVVPYINIGTMGPSASIPFSYVVDAALSAQISLVGSFVSTTPAPEPSTFVLAGMAAVGALAVARRSRRARSEGEKSANV